MKNILIPTNFSPQSDRTLKSVLESLKDSKDPTRILLINSYMVDLSQASADFIQLNDNLKTLSKNGLELEKEKGKEWNSNPNVVIEIASHMGSLSNVILNLVRKEKFDFVAMGLDEGKRVEQISSLLKKHKGPQVMTFG